MNLKKIRRFLITLLIISAISFISCSKGGKIGNLIQNRPILFVHGIGGTSTFHTIIEGFSGMLFSNSELKDVLLPKVGWAGNFCLDENPQYCATGWPTGYSKEAWDQTGMAMSNVEKLKEAIDELIAERGSEKIDIMAHSNGSAVTRLLLTYKYPEYAEKIRKVIFFSGYADVSGCTEGNNVCRYLNDVTNNLPENIEYHAISSESDSMMDYVSIDYGNDIRFFKNNEGQNHNIVGQGHLMITTSKQAFETAYNIITGKQATCPIRKSKVQIAGFVKKYSDYFDYGSYGVYSTSQELVSGAKIKIEYFNPETGETIKTVQEELITDDNGRWGPIKVSSKKNLKITVTSSDETASKVMFFAQKITQNNLNLFTEEPTVNPDLANASAGSVFVFNVSMGQYFNRSAYKSMLPTTLDGNIKVTNNTGQEVANINLDESKTMPVYAPTASPLTWVNYIGFTNLHGVIYTDYGAGVYGFGPSLYPDNTITYESTLDYDKANASKTTIQFNGDDLSEKKTIWVYYLYPTSL